MCFLFLVQRLIRTHELLTSDRPSAECMWGWLFLQQCWENVRGWKWNGPSVQYQEMYNNMFMFIMIIKCGKETSYVCQSCFMHFYTHLNFRHTPLHLGSTRYITEMLLYIWHEVELSIPIFVDPDYSLLVIGSLVGTWISSQNTGYAQIFIGFFGSLACRPYLIINDKLLAIVCGHFFFSVGAHGNNTHTATHPYYPLPTLTAGSISSFAYSLPQWLVIYHIRWTLTIGNVYALQMS